MTWLRPDSFPNPVLDPKPFLHLLCKFVRIPTSLNIPLRLPMALATGLPHPATGGGGGLEDLVVSRLNLSNSRIRLCNIWCSPQWQLIILSSRRPIPPPFSLKTMESPQKSFLPLPAMNNFPYLQQKLLWLKSLSRLQSIRNINNPQHPPTAHGW